MDKAIRQFLAALSFWLGQTIVVAQGRSYALPEKESFRRDAASLRRDANRIAHGLRQQFKE